MSLRRRRLEKTSPESMEAAVIRNHLEWLLGMPWDIFTKDTINIKHAQDILDEKHYGLEEIKDRILDFLSIQRSLLFSYKGPFNSFLYGTDFNKYL